MGVAGRWGEAYVDHTTYMVYNLCWYVLSWRWPDSWDLPTTNQYLYKYFLSFRLRRLSHLDVRLRYHFGTLLRYVLAPSHPAAFEQQQFKKWFDMVEKSILIISLLFVFENGFSQSEDSLVESFSTFTVYLENKSPVLKVEFL